MRRICSEIGRAGSEFQLTHSRGVRQGCYYTTHSHTPISTHALTWSATYVRRRCRYCQQLFQLTHSRGVRLYGNRRDDRRIHFNSRTHVECDTRRCIRKLAAVNFNSRTHVECDMKLNRFRHRKQRISTHALTWSATIVQFDVSLKMANFNSRTHVECDHILRPLISFRKISTHALTWSATQPAQTQIQSAMISTHALTWSATMWKHRNKSENRFQLTHSRGVRHAQCSASHAARISTHALTWSATIPRNYCTMEIYISTHALTWSATMFKLLMDFN